MKEPIPFATAQEFGGWLEAHHASESEVFVLLYKAASGRPSITWEEAVLEALCWGWIDAASKSLGPEAWVQRFTPRRPKSIWSQRNREHVARLTEEGRMRPPGLAAVAAAKADGRWDAAYAGPKNMEIPQDFLDALAAGPEKARETYAGLNRQNLFAIYHRLVTAKKPETRAKRIAEFVAKLARGEKFH